jgi:hypothetical protein
MLLKWLVGIMNDETVVTKTLPCIHCGELVWGYGARVPLFPSDVQWGVHLESDKFGCADGLHTAEVAL